MINMKSNKKQVQIKTIKKYNIKQKIKELKELKP